jgi:hypothetical protein
MNIGRTAPKATRDERAASLSPVNIVRWAKAAEERGTVEERDGMCAKGIRKARKLHGLEGRELQSAAIRQESLLMRNRPHSRRVESWHTTT